MPPLLPTFVEIRIPLLDELLEELLLEDELLELEDELLELELFKSPELEVEEVLLEAPGVGIMSEGTPPQATSVEASKHKQKVRDILNFSCVAVVIIIMKCRPVQTRAPLAALSPEGNRR